MHQILFTWGGGEEEWIKIPVGLHQVLSNGVMGEFYSHQWYLAWGRGGGGVKRSASIHLILTGHQFQISRKEYVLILKVIFHHL